MSRTPLLCLLAIPLWGQEQAPAQTPVTPEQTAPSQVRPRAQGPDKKDKSENSRNQNQGESNGTSKDRLFFTLPNFLTLENATNVAPLTTAEKFKVTARGSFDPVEFAWYGAQAGISQAEDHDANYGQGAAGYAQRFAVRFADGTVENFLTRAVFPSFLHQDPRYFQLGKGGFWHRTLYAVSRIFVTRSDFGSTQFNFSEILGSGTAAGIAAFTYHPQDAHNLSSVLDVWGTQVGYDTLSYWVKEFWPDVRRKLHRSESHQPPPQPGAPQPEYVRDSH